MLTVPCEQFLSSASFLIGDSPSPPTEQAESSRETCSKSSIHNFAQGGCDTTHRHPRGWYHSGLPVHSMPRIGGRGAARAPCPNTACPAHWHGRDGTRPRKRLTSMPISHSCSDLVLFDRQQQCPPPPSQFRIPLQAYHVQRHRSPPGPEDGLAIDRYLRLL